ncbi:MAG: DUF4783 domain-containing protein [Rhodothermales bacterium]
MAPYISIVILVIASLLPASVQAQDAGARVLEHIRAALSEADVERLVEHCGERIDLTVLGTSELLSRAQARYVVQSFFAGYPPVRVDLIESSESGGHRFASGEYWNETVSRPLALYVRLGRTESGWQLRELRIERPSTR